MRMSTLSLPIVGLIFSLLPGETAHAQGSWSGAYIGLSAGYSWSSTSTSNGVGCGTTGVGVDYICSSLNPTSLPNAGAIVNSLAGPTSSDAFTGGAHAGVNWQSGALVIGGEVDFSSFDVSTGQSGRGIYPGSGGGGAGLFGNNFVASTSISSDWLITLRGRLGYAVSNSLLVYATGGLAMSRVSVSNRFADDHTDGFSVGGIGGGEHSHLKPGWTAGAGLEWAFAQRWTVRGEYMYVDLGSTKVNSNIINPLAHAGESSPFNSSVDLTSHIARIGISYRLQ